MSLEYTLLGLAGPDYRPDDWTPVDSLAWLKAMAWDLTDNVDDEVARARLSVNHTDAQIAQLYPPYPYGQHAPILPDQGRASQGGRGPTGPVGGRAAGAGGGRARARRGARPGGLR